MRVSCAVCASIAGATSSRSHCASALASGQLTRAGGTTATLAPLRSTITRRRTGDAIPQPPDAVNGGCISPEKNASAAAPPHAMSPPASPGRTGAGTASPAGRGGGKGMESRALPPAAPGPGQARHRLNRQRATCGRARPPRAPAGGRNGCARLYLTSKSGCM